MPKLILIESGQFHTPKLGGSSLKSFPSPHGIHISIRSLNSADPMETLRMQVMINQLLSVSVP